eukprot:2301460-Rhodomonas_salina.1
MIVRSEGRLLTFDPLLHQMRQQTFKHGCERGETEKRSELSGGDCVEEKRRREKTVPKERAKRRSGD